MTEQPGLHTTLEFYRWIIVRFRCTKCHRYGDAPGRSKGGRFIADPQFACGGYCPDLKANLPPDLPPSMRGLTLIDGGRADMLPAEVAPAERRRLVGGEE